MIRTLLLDLLIMYCVCSYVACGVAVYKTWGDNLGTDEKATVGDKVIASAIFFIFAPFVVLNVIYNRLNGEVGE
jgi:hypothetical protein